MFIRQTGAKVKEILSTVSLISFCGMLLFAAFYPKEERGNRSWPFRWNCGVEVALSVGKLTEFEPVSLKFKQALI